MGKPKMGMGMVGQANVGDIVVVVIGLRRVVGRVLGTNGKIIMLEGLAGPHDGGSIRLGRTLLAHVYPPQRDQFFKALLGSQYRFWRDQIMALSR